MKRLEKKSDTINFVGLWNISNDKLCEDIIDFFEKNVHLHNQGAIDSGINLAEKKTTDLTIDPVDLQNKNYSVFNDYFQQVRLITSKSLWSICDMSCRPALRICLKRCIVSPKSFWKPLLSKM